MEGILILAVVLIAGFALIVEDDRRRQKNGPSPNAQFNKAMQELRHDIRSSMRARTFRNKGGYAHFK